MTTFVSWVRAYQPKPTDATPSPSEASADTLTQPSSCAHSTVLVSEDSNTNGASFSSTGGDAGIGDTRESEDVTSSCAGISSELGAMSINLSVRDLIAWATFIADWISNSELPLQQTDSTASSGGGSGSGSGSGALVI